MANTFRNEIYRSSKTLSHLAMAFLGSLIFCYILYIFFSFGQIFFPDSVMDLGDGESMSVALGLIGLVAILAVPLYICTVIFFLIWEYRAFNNLSALKAGNLEFSPGWAVGWWFIPFANLVKPFQAMRELWNESDPDFDADLGFLSSSVSAPTIMGFWWAFWLISNFTDRIAGKMTESEYFPVAMIISSIFGILAAGLLIKIIIDITRRQELRFQKLNGSDMFSPPPPPSFDQNA